MAASIPATHKQYQYTKYGAPEDEWEVVVVPPKTLKPTHVRIQVSHASLNPVDYKTVEYGASWFFGRALTEEDPFMVGFDCSGTVVEVGADVGADSKVGDAVCANTPTEDFGSLAEYISVDPKHVALKLANLDFAAAAGIPLAGERVLTLGGSTGTGIFGIQLAEAVGARVIATASACNAASITPLGADQAIEYTTDKWMDVLDDHSVDLIYDCGVEPQAWEDAAQQILKKDTGRFVTIGMPQNPRESTIGTTFMFHYCEPLGDDLRDITRHIEKNQTKSVVDSVHSFENVIEANNKVKAGKAVGKVVIKIAN
ncbi:Reticulon-4-interacting protein 1, partial [Globisporangium splendens]